MRVQFNILIEFLYLPRNEASNGASKSGGCRGDCQVVLFDRNHAASCYLKTVQLQSMIQKISEANATKCHLLVLVKE
jgi:hypothetical protein